VEVLNIHLKGDFGYKESIEIKKKKDNMPPTDDENLPQIQG
jgi:hypothetical protein